MNNKADEVTADTASYQRIFTSTSIIGGASIVSILIGLVRVKLIAVLLGPAGVGLIGLYAALMNTAATAAQLGVGIVGTRQIAEAHAKADAIQLAIARRALFLAALALSMVGGLAVWLSRDQLARWVFDDPAAGGSVAWLALGVALSVAAASQSALIRGMRRVSELALITIFSAVLGAVIGVPLVWWLGQGGIAIFVVVAPASAFVLGHVFVARLPKATPANIATADLSAQWKMLVRLGLPFMGSALAATAIGLWIRTDIQRQLGAEALGNFEASWAIAMHYVGFVLGAMSADYYPRLTGVIDKPADACRLVNQQTEVALLLSGCVILALLALAPWVIALLYTAEFAEATVVLQWQALATVLKVASWPLGYVILAAGAGRKYFLTETVTLLLMAISISLLIPLFGLEAAGIGYLASYVFYLPLVYVLAVRSIGFGWSGKVKLSFGLLAGLGLVVFATNMLFPAGALLAAGLAMAIYGIFAVQLLSQMGLFVAFTEGHMWIRNFIKKPPGGTQ